MLVPLLGMHALGHKPVTNFGAGPEVISEAFSAPAAPPPENRISIPYYNPPRRRRAATQPGASSRVDIVLESGVLFDAGPAAPPTGPLPDAAVASFGDSAILEAVIGNDDRVRVARPMLNANPFRQICSLLIRSARGQYFVGTAWFIAPGVVATAGHCVFLHDAGGWAASIQVIPARFGDEAPHGRLNASRFASVDGWTQGKNRDFDYGVIFLDDPSAGKRLGNFEVHARTDGELNGIVAKISGYPADRDRAEFQYFHERPLLNSTATRLVYDIDTFGGQSGSPIWQDTTETGIVAIGIHTNGGITSNSGTRITGDVLDNLIAWTEA